MAVEKWWLPKGPVAFTAPGTTLGVANVTDTRRFKVKAIVTVTDTVQPYLKLEVKRVNSPTQLVLGPVDKPIATRTNLSAYGVTSALILHEQPRNTIPLQDIIRATFEEEPTVAWRTIGVDQWGEPWDGDNPLPVTFPNSISVSTRRLTDNDDDPNLGDIHDAVRIGDGVEEARVTAGQELAVSDGLSQGGVYKNLVLTLANTAYEAKVGATALPLRKALTIQALDADMWWGYDSSVTVGTGTLLKRKNFIVFDIDADSTFQVWVVCATAGKNARITESP